MKCHEVIVKQLDGKGLTDEEFEESFQREVSLLEHMRELRHPHLITTIAAYSRSSQRCFVYPWATGGNLRQFWERYSGPMDYEVVVWAWSQIRGLSEGLKELHSQPVRHGVLKPQSFVLFNSHGGLKPESILLFKTDNCSEFGTLVIAGKGAASFRAEDMRQVHGYRHLNTSNQGTSKYEPPDYKLLGSRPRSRISDSWSLGCIFLEFVIWLMQGKDGLDRFNRERLELAPGRDCFWVQHGATKDCALHPTVKRWVIEELPEPLERTPGLRDLVELVTDRLLVVSREHRAFTHEFDKALRKIHERFVADVSYLWRESSATYQIEGHKSPVKATRPASTGTTAGPPGSKRSFAIKLGSAKQIGPVYTTNMAQGIGIDETPTQQRVRHEDDDGTNRHDIHSRRGSNTLPPGSESPEGDLSHEGRHNVMSEAGNGPTSIEEQSQAEETSILVNKWQDSTDLSLVHRLCRDLNWSEWSVTRQMAASSSQLCPDCSAIDFSRDYYDLGRTLSIIQETAANCTFCGFLCRRLAAAESQPGQLVSLVEVNLTTEPGVVGCPAISLYCEPGTRTKAPYR